VSNLRSFADLAITQDGQDVVIAFGGNTITLLDVSASDLDRHDVTYKPTRAATFREKVAASQSFINADNVDRPTASTQRVSAKSSHHPLRAPTQKRAGSIARLGGRGYISASIPSNVPNFVAVPANATAGRAAYR
jgi:hypothetical protein